uniref:Uncharacterized protein n=1 Tax=Lepeophtheirus salmonis TaxID=72036 RepID=A0A0K2T3A3_LEPSM
MVPPTSNISKLIKLSPFIIKTMSYFVSYNNTYTPKINRFWKILVIEWWLQDSSGKH